MIEIKRVSCADVLASEVLIAEYADECSIAAIGKINPQPDAYAAMENAGLMHSFIAFNDGSPVGFATMLTPVFPHYGKRVATIESLFIAKASRKSSAWRELRKIVKQHAKQVGSVGILYSAPAGGQLEKLLEASKECQRTNAVFFESLT